MSPEFIERGGKLVNHRLSAGKPRSGVGNAIIGERQHSGLRKLASEVPIDSRRK